MIERDGVTIVTVVFETEIPLLRLQALSIAKFLDPAYATQILVIDNSARGIRRASWSRVLRQYGSHARSVKLIRSDAVSEMPVTTGWNSQQVLKLAIARLVDTPMYLTLDAKNHLIRPAGRQDFEAADGRAIANFHGYESHPLRPSLERVFRYVGLDPDDLISRFTATATPFMLYTSRVRALLDDIEATSGRRFADEFLREELTEYFLYSAWLIAKGEILEEVYDSSGIDCPAIWPRGANLRGVRTAVDEAQERDPAVFSVHRTALARMDAAATALLAQFWLERGLFDSRRDIRGFINAFRLRYLFTMASKKLRERRRRR